MQLETFGRLPSGFERVYAIEGDLSLTSLGIKDSSHLEILDEIDAIYHCAANVHRLFLYS